MTSVELRDLASENIEGVARQPNFHLLEARSEPSLEIQEELPIFPSVIDINKHSHEFVLIHRALVLPLAPDSLGFAGGRTEPLSQLNHGLSDEPRRDAPSIVIPAR